MLAMCTSICLNDSLRTTQTHHNLVLIKPLNAMYVQYILFDSLTQTIDRMSNQPHRQIKIYVNKY